MSVNGTKELMHQIHDAIDYVCEEFDMTRAEVIGVLATAQAQIVQEAVEGSECDDYGDEFIAE